MFRKVYFLVFAHKYIPITYYIAKSRKYQEIMRGLKWLVCIFQLIPKSIQIGKQSNWKGKDFHGIYSLIGKCNDCGMTGLYGLSCRIYL